MTGPVEGRLVELMAADVDRPAAHPIDRPTDRPMGSSPTDRPIDHLDRVGCSVGRCGRSVRARRLCGAHLERLHRHGDVQADRPIAVRRLDGKSYRSALAKVTRERGPARANTCGTPGCDRSATCWSYAGDDPRQRTTPGRRRPYSLNPNSYRPRCWSCHWSRVRRPKRKQAKEPRPRPPWPRPGAPLYGLSQAELARITARNARRSRYNADLHDRLAQRARETAHDAGAAAHEQQAAELRQHADSLDPTPTITAAEHRALAEQARKAAQQARAQWQDTLNELAARSPAAAELADQLRDTTPGDILRHDYDAADHEQQATDLEQQQQQQQQQQQEHYTTTRKTLSTPLQVPLDMGPATAAPRRNGRVAPRRNGRVA